MDSARLPRIDERDAGTGEVVDVPGGECERASTVTPGACLEPTVGLVGEVSNRDRSHDPPPVISVHSHDVSAVGACVVGAWALGGWVVGACVLGPPVVPPRRARSAGR